jgi:hypothetical protein
LLLLLPLLQQLCMGWMVSTTISSSSSSTAYSGQTTRCCKGGCEPSVKGTRSTHSTQRPLQLLLLLLGVALLSLLLPQLQQLPPAWPKIHTRCQWAR